jgi:hypothetical protein
MNLISRRASMAESARGWVSVANYGAGYEADIAIALLDGAGIQAVRRGRNGYFGITGIGSEGWAPGGFDVLVLADFAEEARSILADDDDGG